MASGSFPVDEAQLVALYMQCILYGMVLIAASTGLRVLLWTRDGNLKSKHSINWVMLGATTVMFIVATFEMAFGLQHVLEAFIYYQGPGGAEGAFAHISDWVNVMRIADYNLQTWIGDGIMIYRCYVIYNRQWKIVVLPALLWLAEGACSCVVIYIEATLHTESWVNDSRLAPFITTTLMTTLALTIITTGLIVYKIWRINTRVASENVSRVSGGTRSLTRVVCILVESGLLYTVSVIILFGTYLTGSTAELPVSDCIVQIIPISFVLIIIRADRGLSASTSTTQWSITPQTAVALRSLSSPYTTSHDIAVPAAAEMRGGSTYSQTDISIGWKDNGPIV